MKTYEMEITTGFRTGNLAAGWEGVSAEIEAEMAANYAQVLAASLRADFPNANVTVNYDGGQGILGHPLETRVWLANTDEIFDEQNDPHGLVRAVDFVADDVYEKIHMWAPASMLR